MFFSVVIVSACGCASSVHVRSVSPDAYATASPIASTKPVRITVRDFDLKTGKPSDTIGEAKTGVFNMSTPITSDEPANVIVPNAIRKGVYGAGLQRSDSDAADYSLDGAVEAFWVDEHATGFSPEFSRAFVRYDVTLRDSSGRIVWANTIERFETSEQSMDATEYDISTLTLALQESVRSLLEDAAFRKAISK